MYTLNLSALIASVLCFVLRASQPHDDFKIETAAPLQIDGKLSGWHKQSNGKLYCATIKR
jgi:hypothetical protein